MLTHNYSYDAALADSLKVNWQVSDLIGGDKKLDFTKPFLPEALAGVRGITCLSAKEKLLLNQIRGNSYLYLFGFVEEFILPYVVDELRRKTPGGNDVAVRALAKFADEEAKHMQLFHRFAEAFKAGFPTPCGVIPGAGEVAKVVLSHSRLGVALLTLDLEWMTQAHYVDAAKNDGELDPLFVDLLKHHWMEEAQHAKLDVILVDEIAREGDAAAIGKAFEDLQALGGAVDGLLAQQVQLDITSLETAAGRTFNDADRQEIVKAQTRAYRYTFLSSGLSHKNFLTTCEQLAPGSAEQLRGMAQALIA